MIVVVMRASHRWLDAGRERLLIGGDQVSLPDPVALCLIDAGMADRVTTTTETIAKVEPPYATKPAPAVATKSHVA